MTPLQLFLSGQAAAVIGLALAVLATNARSVAHRRFAVAALIIAGWTLGVSGRLSGTGIEAWLRLSFACASLIPPAVLAFADAYPEARRPPAPRLLYPAVALGGAFALLSLTTRLIFFEPVMTPSGLSRKPGPLYGAFAAYFLVTWGLSVGVLLRRTLAARGPARAQMRYLTAATVLMSAGAITTNLLLPLITGRSSYTWLGPCFGAVFVVLVGHAIFRHRLMDVRLSVHRGLARALAGCLSLAPLALPLAWFWPQLAGLEWPALPLFLLALLAGGMLVPYARAGAVRMLDHYAYRPMTDYQATVQQISKALAHEVDRTALLHFLVTQLTRIARPEGLAIYLFDDGTGTALTRHVTPSESFRVPDPLPGPLHRALLARRDAIEPDGHYLLAELHWALLLPLIADGAVIGAIAIGPKRSGDPYYPQDLHLLRTLANQAGIAIKNAQLYAEVVLAHEYVGNIVATINSGVVAITAAGKITLFNRAAEHLTGLGADQVRAGAVSALPRCLSEPLTHTVAEGRPISCPEISLTAGGTVRPVICAVSPLRDTTGAILGGVAVFSDLTPVKEREGARARAEKLAYLESLASGLAHEIKNPLVSIKTFVQLIPLRLGDAKWLEDFSRLVEREIERIERLLNQLATLSRTTTRPQRELDLRHPIQEALELVQPALAAKGIAVAARLGAAEHTVLGDYDELTQLAHNLLINALEHTPAEGKVDVELVAAAGRVTLTVTDTGPGIPFEFLERVFDPFFTTRARGTGLGLAICQGIATTHRARMRVANGPSQGAVFAIDFPLAESAAPAPA
jgi:two-component system nitrogen regulation sensor histidine kinase GlnL